VGTGCLCTSFADAARSSRIGQNKKEKNLSSSIGRRTIAGRSTASILNPRGSKLGGDEAFKQRLLGLMRRSASPGAAMAFLVTGAGTSVGAVVGALTIARWRVLAVVVGTLWVGAIVSGYAFDALMAGRLF
jgi:hypothetical protein